MNTQVGIGQALAEMVERLTPEEKLEFAHWLSWKELEALRRQAVSPAPAKRPARRAGEPQVYVGATSDGLALELPAECVLAFVKRLPVILSASFAEVYVRKGGKGKEYHVSQQEFADFMDTQQDTLLEGSLMIELDGVTLVSGGGGCLLLTMEGKPGEIRRRLATESLRVCGFEQEFQGDHFTAAVWDDALEVSDQ